MGTTHRFARISVPLLQVQFEHSPLNGQMMFPAQFMKHVHSSRHTFEVFPATVAPLVVGAEVVEDNFIVI